MFFQWKAGWNKLAHPMENNQLVEKKIYRVEGFSCANCAGKFEQNVKRLPGVYDAKVNFGASKITVYGEATIAELEEAGAFENLKIYPEEVVNATAENPEKRFKQWLKANWSLIISLFFSLIGFVSLYVFGENSWLTISVFLGAIAVGGYPLFKTGLKHLFEWHFDMKVLMTIAIIGATIIGEWAEAAVVVILFAISEALETYSMERARESIRSLMKLAPKEASIVRDGIERKVPVEDIEVGDVMLVKPGEKIAMDGIVINGNSTVNEAAITGESIPKDKRVDDEVFAGTINQEGYLEVKVTKLAEDTTLAKIIHLVEEAQAERAPHQQFVDQFAKYYTPIIMIVAFLTAIIPPLFLQADWGKWIYLGLAVLVVGCPCALVISTPISIVSAIGNAAKKGVLIKGGVHLEKLGQLKAIAFDKTGTLTKGEPVVTDVILLDDSMEEKELLAIAGAIESRSEHPVAQAIVDKVKKENVSYQTLDVTNVSAVIGKGIKGTIASTTYWIGKVNLFEPLRSVEKDVIEKLGALEREGKTAMLVGTENRLLGIIAVRDEIRSSSKAAITKLNELGIEKTVMLTGDNETTAEAIGADIGVADVRSELMPEDKVECIKRLQEQHGEVAMVGDGINDAPALAAATVGIAVSDTGTDTAMETADIVLMSGDLEKLPFAVRLSRKTLNVIKANITFSLAIKLFALLLVLPGWLTLWIAILADVGATIIVALNGLRLLRVKE